MNADASGPDTVAVGSESKAISH
ncbi:TPA: hypothetical protein ACPOOB_000503 [Haemophilus influenzae]